MPTIDVVVPCYNYGRFLVRCVTSLLAQEDVTVRVLVIDDASTDDTPQISSALAARDPRVTFRRHETNAGHIATYNEGLLGWARAEYSLLISADDVVAPGAFRRAAALMARHPEMGMTYGMAVVIRDEDGPPANLGPASDETRVLPGADFLRFCCERAYCPVSTPTAIVRTSAQHAVGGYSADLPHSGDLEMWMRFAVRGPIGVLRSVQGFYRWHQANMAHQYFDRELGDRREFLLTCERVLGPERERLPEAPRWLEAMHRQVARDAVRSARISYDLGDDAVCRSWLALARELDPAIGRTPGWWRVQIRRAVGRPVLRVVRPWVHRILTRSWSVGPLDAGRTAHFKGYRSGDRVGWWPGAGS